MPLLPGKDKVGYNIREMEAAGHPHDQAVAASLRKAGIKRKGNKMDKNYGGDGMAGEKGMSPRKAIASGMMKGGNFGAKQIGSLSLGPHPDHTANTGMKGAVGDGERGARPGINHTKGHHPAQAAPMHGPHHPGGYGDHARGGKV